uniref:Uncharacterized protein n=1 Tax=Ciona savignyi TaxID=51511 RepID=H2YQY2_CIOSA
MQTNFVLMAQNTIVACSKLQWFPPKSAKARISWGGVHGMVKFHQNSFFDPTIIWISLHGLKNFPVRFSVYDFPVPQKLSTSEDRCRDANVGSIFNPYHYNIDVIGDALVTDDLYAIGDLAGKIGALTTDGFEYYTDWNLPLYGRNSIVGRSIVLVDANMTRVCANIHEDGDVITAVAEFRYPAYGTLYMR